MSGVNHNEFYNSETLSINENCLWPWKFQLMRCQSDDSEIYLGYCCLLFICLVTVIQVSDYPTLLLYTAIDKANLVISDYNKSQFFLLWFICVLYSQLVQEIVFTVQINLSTKSSLKDVATTINKHLKAKDNAAKGEL